MSEPFKLEFKRMPSGLLRADFLDEDGERCVLKEANIGKEIWLGYTGGDRLYFNCEQAKAIGFALIRFAKNGSLAEPSPEQVAEHFTAAFDESDQHDNLQTLVATFARAFVRAKDPGDRALARTAMEQAVENLEAWLKERGWEGK